MTIYIYLQEAQLWLAEMKAITGADEIDYDSIDPSMLNEKQSLAYEVLLQWFQQGFSEQLLMHIQGKNNMCYLKFNFIFSEI